MAASNGKKRNSTTATATGATPGQKRRVVFRLEAPEAQSVALAGSFNDWNPTATPLKRDARGVWRTQISLAPGRYEYRYVVDGEWRDDPRATETSPNEFGGRNCVVMV